MHILDNERLVLIRALCECICQAFPKAVIFGATPHNIWMLSQCPSVRKKCDTINVVMEYESVNHGCQEAYGAFKKLRSTIQSFGILKHCKPPIDCREFLRQDVMHLMFYYRCGYLQSTYSLLKIRLNIVFTSNRDKLDLLKDNTYMTTKSTKNAVRTLLDVQSLCKKSCKAQFTFSVADIEDKELDVLCKQNNMMCI